MRRNKWFSNLCGSESTEPHACVCGYAETLPWLFAEGAVHAGPVPHACDSHPRRGTAARPRPCQDTCVCHRATCSQESGSAVRSVEESDRVAPTASAPHEVRSRTVLPGGQCAESETASKVPRSTTTAAVGGDGVGRKKKRGRTRQSRAPQRESEPLSMGLFQQPQALALTKNFAVWGDRIC
jgi:hypothetical protein